MKAWFLVLLFLINYTLSAQTTSPAVPSQKSASNFIQKKTAPSDYEEEEEFDEEELFFFDSLNPKGYLSLIFWDINDSLANIPAYDLYCNWNTYVIHPYSFDVSKKKDTSLVFLQDEHKCDYHHPFPGHITSPFGPRRGRYHYGIDIKLQTGDSVHNAFDGVVRIARRSPSYGNVVVVRHNNGLETLYAHLEKLEVQPGDPVESGALLGLGGNTGRSTGSHLHFEIRYKGEPINPNDVICFDNYILRRDTLVITNKTFNYLVEARAAKFHVVRNGDTLGKIAKKYRTSISALCRLNGIKPTTKLRVGRKIRYK
jgi:murein DD-endopeptidase MepM/ murein hydrolase activator NlpD